MIIVVDDFSEASRAKLCHLKHGDKSCRKGGN